MRVARFGLLIFLLSGVSVWAQSAIPPQAFSTQPANDAQAVAVVQNAITAMGGASVISRIKSWTFQGTLQGSGGNGNISETIAYTDANETDAPKKTFAKNVHRSIFTAALLGPILLAESSDPSLVMRYGGTIALNSKNYVIITILFVDQTVSAMQSWYFDTVTSLPFRIDFGFPAQVGLTESLPGAVVVSNYQTVQGVLYPFQIIETTFTPMWSESEILTMQKVDSATPLP